MFNYDNPYQRNLHNRQRKSYKRMRLRPLSAARAHRPATISYHWSTKLKTKKVPTFGYKRFKEEEDSINQKSFKNLFMRVSEKRLDNLMQIRDRMPFFSDYDIISDTDSLELSDQNDLTQTTFEHIQAKNLIRSAIGLDLDDRSQVIEYKNLEEKAVENFFGEKEFGDLEGECDRKGNDETLWEYYYRCLEAFEGVVDMRYFVSVMRFLKSLGKIGMVEADGLDAGVGFDDGDWVRGVCVVEVLMKNHFNQKIRNFLLDESEVLHGLIEWFIGVSCHQNDQNATLNSLKHQKNDFGRNSVFEDQGLLESILRIIVDIFEYASISMSQRMTLINEFFFEKSKFLKFLEISLKRKFWISQASFTQLLELISSIQQACVTNESVGDPKNRRSSFFNSKNLPLWYNSHSSEAIAELNRVVVTNIFASPYKFSKSGRPQIQHQKNKKNSREGSNANDGIRSSSSPGKSHQTETIVRNTKNEENQRIHKKEKKDSKKTEDLNLIEEIETPDNQMEVKKPSQNKNLEEETEKTPSLVEEEEESLFSQSKKSQNSDLENHSEAFYNTKDSYFYSLLQVICNLTFAYNYQGEGSYSEHVRIRPTGLLRYDRTNQAPLPMLNGKKCLKKILRNIEVKIDRSWISRLYRMLYDQDRDASQFKSLQEALILEFLMSVYHSGFWAFGAAKQAAVLKEDPFGRNLRFVEVNSTKIETFLVLLESDELSSVQLERMGLDWNWMYLRLFSESEGLYQEFVKILYRKISDEFYDYNLLVEAIPQIVFIVDQICELRVTQIGDFSKIQLKHFKSFSEVKSTLLIDSEDQEGLSVRERALEISQNLKNSLKTSQKFNKKIQPKLKKFNLLSIGNRFETSQDFLKASMYSLRVVRKRLFILEKIQKSYPYQQEEVPPRNLDIIDLRGDGTSTTQELGGVLNYYSDLVKFDYQKALLKKKKKELEEKKRRMREKEAKEKEGAEGERDGEDGEGKTGKKKNKKESSESQNLQKNKNDEQNGGNGAEGEQENPGGSVGETEEIRDGGEATEQPENGREGIIQEEEQEGDQNSSEDDSESNEDNEDNNNTPENQNRMEIEQDAAGDGTGFYRPFFNSFQKRYICSILHKTEGSKFQKKFLGRAANPQRRALRERNPFRFSPRTPQKKSQKSKKLKKSTSKKKSQKSKKSSVRKAQVPIEDFFVFTSPITPLESSGLTKTCLRRDIQLGTIIFINKRNTGVRGVEESAGTIFENKSLQFKILCLNTPQVMFGGYQGLTEVVEPGCRHRRLGRRIAFTEFTSFRSPRESRQKNLGEMKDSAKNDIGTPSEDRDASDDENERDELRGDPGSPPQQDSEDMRVEHPSLILLRNRVINYVIADKRSRKIILRFEKGIIKEKNGNFSKKKNVDFEEIVEGSEGNQQVTGGGLSASRSDKDLLVVYKSPMVNLGQFLIKSQFPYSELKNEFKASKIAINFTKRTTQTLRLDFSYEKPPLQVFKNNRQIRQTSPKTETNDPEASQPSPIHYYHPPSRSFYQESSNQNFIEIQTQSLKKCSKLLNRVQTDQQIPSNFQEVVLDWMMFHSNYLVMITGLKKKITKRRQEGLYTRLRAQRNPFIRKRVYVLKLNLRKDSVSFLGDNVDLGQFLSENAEILSSCYAQCDGESDIGLDSTRAGVVLYGPCYMDSGLFLREVSIEDIIRKVIPITKQLF